MDLDDDGDGFIDCYDPDCALNTACDDIFIGVTMPPVRWNLLQLPRLQWTLDFRL